MKKTRLFRRKLLSACGLLTAALLISVSLAAGVNITEKACLWQIQKAQIVDYGQTTITPHGTLITGYKVEAVAEGPGTPIAEGKFQATMSLFSPKEKMPGQKPGFWYLSGIWSITDVTAAPQVAKARHSKAAIKGRLMAELPFYPADGSQGFGIQVAVPTSPFWGRGEGTYSNTGMFDGQLSLTLQRPGRAK